MNSNFTLKHCLFRGVKFAKNADLDKYVYRGCVVGFDLSLLFSILNFSWAKNGIIFGVGVSSSVHIDNKKKVTTAWWYCDNSRSWIFN